jgi:hypothetical protein
MKCTFDTVPVLKVGASGAAATAPSLIIVEMPTQFAADLTYMIDATNATMHYVLLAPADYGTAATEVVPANWQTLIQG